MTVANPPTSIVVAPAPEVVSRDVPAADLQVVPTARPVKAGAPYVLGLYSSGGGGHVSALDSIETCLHTFIDVRRVAPLREIFHRIDPVSRMTLRRYDGELLFNMLAERGNIGLLGLLEKIGTRRVRTHRRAMAALFNEAIRFNPPALIVSTMPFINAAVSDVAAAMGIPFVVVPTDYDLTNFVAGLPTPLPPGQHVVHAFASQASQFDGTMVGYPLRPHLAQPVSATLHAELRQSAGIPAGRRVIVLMVGSAGGVRALDIARRLARGGAGQNYHLVICCGRNKKLLQQAKAFTHPDVTVDARGYTTDMVGLFGIADVLITKPGGGTVMEALALGVPTILDHAKSCVPWERANLTLALRFGARVLEDTQQVGPLVQETLAMPRAFAAAAPFPDFQTGFRALTAACLPSS